MTVPNQQIGWSQESKLLQYLASLIERLTKVVSTVSPDVNIADVDGNAVDTGAGNAGPGTMRVSVSTDDVNLAAIKTAIEIIDNFISGNRGLVTEDNSGAIKTAVEIIDNFISGSRGRVTEDNSGAIKTAVEIMDDWDENDRNKVNLIVGQAGIAAGAGAVGVTVPRVTLASDDPAVALLRTVP